jgi:NADH dehydrogenase
VATAALSPGDIAWPIRAIFRRQRNVRVLMAEATGIDRAAKVVHAAGGLALPCDVLVLATGATHSYFGHDEWAPVAPRPQDDRGRDGDPSAAAARLRAGGGQRG